MAARTGTLPGMALTRAQRVDLLDHRCGVLDEMRPVVAEQAHRRYVVVARASG